MRIRSVLAAISLFAFATGFSPVVYANTNADRVSCTAKEMQMIEAARTSAIAKLSRAVRAKQGSPSIFEADVRKWFGAFSTGGSNAAMEKFVTSRMESATLTALGTVWCPKGLNSSSPGGLAYVRRNGKIELYANPNFFKLPVGGKKLTKWGAFLHEAIHLTDTNITDYCYGKVMSLELAKPNPDRNKISSSPNCAKGPKLKKLLTEIQGGKLMAPLSADNYRLFVKQLLPKLP